MNRADCLEYLYAFLCGTKFVFRESFDSEMESWEIRPMMVGDTCIGVIMNQGPEIHVALDRRGALKHAAKIIHECLVKGIEQHGHLTTRASRDNAEVHRFLSRLGFEVTHEESGCSFYRIDHIKIQ